MYILKKIEEYKDNKNIISFKEYKKKFEQNQFTSDMEMFKIIEYNIKNNIPYNITSDIEEVYYSYNYNIVKDYLQYTVAISKLKENNKD